MEIVVQELNEEIKLLSPDEQILIVGLLTDFIATKDKPRALLCSPLPNEFAIRLGYEPSLPGKMVEAAVKICLADKFNHTPTWLESLLEGLLPSNAQVAPIIKRLRNPPPPAPDPLEAILLSMDMPFLNRVDLRKRLRVLRNPQSLKPILIVIGPRQSGKSYSTLLIEHYCSENESLLYSQVPLLAGQEEIIGAKEIASDLVAQMGRPTSTIPAAHTNEDRWARELATWVLAEAVATTQDWWLVLDGFNSPNVRPDARKLIIHLADQVTRGVFSRRCRVILLDFDRSGLTVQPGKILLEEIEPVERAEITACVDAILKRTGQNADVDQTVASILYELPEDESKMLVLNQRLIELLEAAEAIHV